jgi:hypothetical protein
VRTFIVITILIVSFLLFSRDARKLVLDPLERMIEKVKMIAKDPLADSSNKFVEAGMISFEYM